MATVQLSVVIIVIFDYCVETKYCRKITHSLRLLNQPIMTAELLMRTRSLTIQLNTPTQSEDFCLLCCSWISGIDKNTLFNFLILIYKRIIKLLSFQKMFRISDLKNCNFPVFFFFGMFSCNLCFHTPCYRPSWKTVIPVPKKSDNPLLVQINIPLHEIL